MTEARYSREIPVLVSYTGVETTFPRWVELNNLAVAWVDSTRSTILIISTLYLDHTNRTTWFHNLTKFLFVLLPDTNLLIIVNAIDWVTNEPTVTLISFRTIGKFYNLVFIGVPVNTSLPCPTVKVIDDYTIERKFEALILCLTNISHIRTYTRGWRKANTHQQILGFLSIILCSTSQATIKQWEIYTKVIGLRILPSKFLIRKFWHIETCCITCWTKVIRTTCKSSKCLIRIYRLVRSFTITGTELQVINPLNILHKVFLSNIPTKTYSRICMYTMTRS